MTCDGHWTRGNHAEELHKSMDRIGVSSWAEFYFEVFPSRRQHQSIEKTSQYRAIPVSPIFSSIQLCAWDILLSGPLPGNIGFETVARFVLEGQRGECLQ